MAEFASLFLSAQTKGIEKAERDVGDLGRAGDKTSRSVDKLGQETKKTSREARTLARESNKASQGIGSILSQSVLTAGALALLTTGFVRFASASSRQSFGFEKAIAETATLGTNVALVREESLRLAEVYSAGATEQVTAFYQAQSAGAEDLVARVDVANKLATGGIASLASSITLLSGTSNAFSLFDLTDIQIADIFFNTVEDGLTNIPQLAQSFSNVSGVAASFGVELEEVAAAIAAITATGTPTAQATTQIRALISSLARATPELKEYAASIGIASLAPENFTEIINKLNEALTAAGSQAGRDAILLRFFGAEVESLGGAANLAFNANEKFRASLEKNRSVFGATDRAVSIVADTLENRYQIALNRINTAQIEFGDQINQRLVPFLEVYSGLVGVAVDNMDTLIISGGIVAGTVLPALAIGLYKVAVALGVATGGLSVIGGLVGALAATGFVAYINSTDEATEATDDYTGALGEANKAARAFAEDGNKKTATGVIETAIELRKAAVAARELALATLDARVQARALAEGHGVVFADGTFDTTAQEAALAKANENLLTANNNLRRVTSGVGDALNPVDADGNGNTPLSGALTKITNEARGAYTATQSLADAYNTDLRGGITSVADTIGSGLTASFKDFSDFGDALLGNFQGLLAKLASTAIANPILISFGLGGLNAGGTVAQGAFGGFGQFLTGQSAQTGFALTQAGQAQIIAQQVHANALGGATTSAAGLGAGGAGLFGGIGAGALALGIGAPIAALGFLNAALGTRTVSQGFRGSIEGGELDGEGFRVRKNGFLARRRYSESTSELDAGFADPFQQGISDYRGRIAEQASLLNAELNGGRFNFQIETRGRSQAQIQADTNKALQDYGESLASSIPFLDSFIQEGESATKTLAELTAGLDSANTQVRLLGLGGFDTSVLGAGLAREFAEGLESGALSTANNFLSEADQRAFARASFDEQLSSAGITASIDTTDDFTAETRRLDDARRKATQAGDDELARALNARLIALFNGGNEFAASLERSNRAATPINVGDIEFQTLADRRYAELVQRNTDGAIDEARKQTQLLIDLIAITTSGTEEQIRIAQERLRLVATGGDA